jgi:hypothetical protein
MNKDCNNIVLGSDTEKTIAEIRRLLSGTLERNTIHKLRESVNSLREQLLSQERQCPSHVNRIITLMQDVFEFEERFRAVGLRNIEGAPQLRHDLVLTVAILPEILDRNTEETIALTPDLNLYDWLVAFKDSKNFDRKATHPLSLSHVVIRALILFGLDKNRRYNVDNIFRTIAVAVFKRHIHHSYFEYAAQYVRLNSSSLTDLTDPQTNP